MYYLIYNYYNNYKKLKAYYGIKYLDIIWDIVYVIIRYKMKIIHILGIILYA